jgi:hypothetical protein
MAGTLHDDVFGDFDWGNTEYCSGTLTFLGATIPWSLELDCSEDPTARDFEDAIPLAKATYRKLTAAWELESRKEAARQVLASVYHQSQEAPPSDQIAKLVEDMQIDRIDFLCTSGNDTANVTLRYTSPKVFPAQKIVVQFDEHLKPWEVTLQS